MKYIEAPDEVDLSVDEASIFLAGGITGVSDWQSQIVEKIKHLDITVLNPRRKNFPIDDPKQASKQIVWEFEYIRMANFISFWFPKETVCPITLYELGAHSMSNKPLIIGVDPEYKRRKDIEIQTKLVRPEIEIVYSLEDLAKQIEIWYKFFNDGEYNIIPMETIGIKD